MWKTAAMTEVAADRRHRELVVILDGVAENQRKCAEHQEAVVSQLKSMLHGRRP